MKMKIKCYGCNEDRNYYRRMRVEYERKPQKFCKECFKGLVKIKMGIL